MLRHTKDYFLDKHVLDIFSAVKKLFTLLFSVITDKVVSIYLLLEWNETRLSGLSFDM